MVKLHRIQINKDQLKSIPEKERVFFLKITHLFSETNLLQKMAAFSNNKNINYEALRKAQNSQTFLILLILAGKLFEGSKMIEKDFFKSSLSKEYYDLLSDEGKESLNYIKEYFGKKNIIKEIRHKFSHHLDSEKIKEAFDCSPADEVFEFYFSEQYANNFFWLTGNMISYNIMDILDRDDPTKALAKFFDELLNTAKWFQNFIGDYVSVVVGKYWGASEGDTFTIGDAPSLDKVFLPYFVERRNKTTSSSG